MLDNQDYYSKVYSIRIKYLRDKTVMNLITNVISTNVMIVRRTGQAMYVAIFVYRAHADAHVLQAAALTAFASLWDCKFTLVARFEAKVAVSAAAALAVAVATEHRWEIAGMQSTPLAVVIASCAAAIAAVEAASLAAEPTSIAALAAAAVAMDALAPLMA